jgi:predicted choloylglycine hydrolase
MTTRSLLTSLLALLAWLSPALAQDQQPFRFPEGGYGDKAVLKYLSGLPVLTVAGSPEEMGAAVGVLAVANAPRALNYPRDLLKLHRADAVWPVCVQTGNGMVQRFPAAFKQELEAIVKAAKVDRDKVVVGNTLFDLKKIFACSALLIEGKRSTTGGPLLGRNLDYPSIDSINEYSLVTIYRPTGKHAFAAVGFPGLIGVISGMNDAGLALGMLEVFDVKDGERGFNPLGVPYALNNRQILEECTTIEEARKLLLSLPRTTTLNLVLADRTGVAVFEVTPDRVEVRHPDRGTLGCTNHYCTQPLRPANPTNPNRTFQRLEALEKSRLDDAKISPADLKQYLHQVNLNRLTLQTMVFEPAALRLNLALGPVPASQNPLRVLELGPLFKGELPK